MNLLTAQINEIVTDLFDKGYYPDDLTKPFSNKMFWDQSIPYESAMLNFNNAEMKITGWINAAELITGSDESFNTMLIESFKAAITEQWELRMTVLVEDGFKQLELNSKYLIQEERQRRYEQRFQSKLASCGDREYPASLARQDIIEAEQEKLRMLAAEWRMLRSERTARNRKSR